MMNPDVQWFFSKTTKWQTEYAALREIVLSTKLEETLKWGKPCYVLGKANMVLIHGFKEYCALLFIKGALLKDPKKLLVQQTDNVQVPRQVRFSTIEEITKNKSAIVALIKDAIAVEKSGIKPILKKTTEFAMPAEFSETLKQMPELKTAFNKLTPGRQRGYLLFFSVPKQSKTIQSRIEKHIPSILDGKGLND